MSQQGLKTPTAAELIDELGDIRQRLAVVKPLAKRAEALRDIIVGWMAGKKPGATATFEGKRFRVVVGEQQNQRTVVNVGKLFDRLGRKRFLEVCSVTLKAVEESVAVPDRAEFIKEEQVGARKLEVVPIQKGAK